MSDNAIMNNELAQELLALVAREGMVELDQLKLDAALEDLDIISADFILILMAIEEEYGAYISVDNELTEVKTVRDLLTVVIKKITEHRQASPA